VRAIDELAFLPPFPIIEEVGSIVGSYQQQRVGVVQDMDVILIRLAILGFMQKWLGICVAHYFILLRFVLQKASVFPHTPSPMCVPSPFSCFMCFSYSETLSHIPSDNLRLPWDVLYDQARISSKFPQGECYIFASGMRE